MYRSFSILLSLNLLFGCFCSFPPIIDTLNQTSSYFVRFDGVDQNDKLSFDFGGSPISGDLNNDSISDFVLTSSSAEPQGRIDAGEAYVVFGRTNWNPPCTESLPRTASAKTPEAPAPRPTTAHTAANDAYCPPVAYTVGCSLNGYFKGTVLYQEPWPRWTSSL